MNGATILTGFCIIYGALVKQAVETYMSLVSVY